jgi:hypothetical protein
MAKNFTFYQMVGCVFHFETLLDGAALQSETGQVGSIYMHSFADSKSADFASSGEFEHQDYVNSAKITQGLTCGVECDPKMLSGLDNSGYNKIRFSSVSESDINEYDQGRVQIALDGLNPALAGRVIGKLRVSYKVELIKNQLVTAIGRGTESDIWSRTDTGLSPVIDNVRTSFFGSYDGEERLMLSHPTNNLGCTYKTAVPSTINHGDVTELRFPENLEGFFKVSIRINVKSETEIDPEHASNQGAQHADLMLGGNIVTDGAIAITANAGVLTCGNVEVVPKVGSVRTLGVANAASFSAAQTMFMTNKIGALVVADYTAWADTAVSVDADTDQASRLLKFGGSVRDLGSHKLVDTQNVFIYTDELSAGNSDLPSYAAVGITEVYVRLRPSTGGVVNKIMLLNGLEYKENASTSLGTPMDAIEVTVERADDHSQYGSVYESL